MIPEELRKTRLERAARFAGQKSTAPTDWPSIANKADDLEAIEKSVGDAAAISGGLWLSYLFVLFYLAVAAGAVTHVDLLLDSPVQLPFLNIQLPLKVFFILAPFLFLITHAHALVHFNILGQKVSRFHTELYRQLPDVSDATDEHNDSPKKIRDGLRRLLPSNIFVQLLAGPPESRGGIFGIILKLIFVTTLVIFPVLLLLLLQIQFLPYHDEIITWAQRGALLLDICLLWIFRPPTFLSGLVSYGSQQRETHGRGVRVTQAFGLVSAGVATLLAIWLACVIATIPDEWQETNLAWLNPTIWTDSFSDDFGHARIRTISMRQFLFSGDVDYYSRRRKSLFSNTLVLPGFNEFDALKIDDPKNIAWKGQYIDLRGRDLQNAVLDNAILIKADLTGAHLEGASLFFTQLAGADLSSASLEGASLYYATLQGANLSGANLQGAQVFDSKLQGANLRAAKLQGANFFASQIEGADFTFAQLQGASIVDSQLEGAVLDLAKIEATDLSYSDLWRTGWDADSGPAPLANIRVEATTWTPSFDDLPPSVISLAHRKEKNYDDLKRSLDELPPGPIREEALNRIGRLDCGSKDQSLQSCDADAALPAEAQKWQLTLRKAGVNESLYDKALTVTLEKLICSGEEDRLEVLRGLMANKLNFFVDGDVEIPLGRLASLGRNADALLDFIMSKNCPVFRQLSQSDKEKLHALQKEIPRLSSDKK